MMTTDCAQVKMRLPRALLRKLSAWSIVCGTPESQLFEAALQAHLDAAVNGADALQQRKFHAAISADRDRRTNKLLAELERRRNDEGTR